MNDLLGGRLAAGRGQGNCETGTEGRHGSEHREIRRRALLVRSEGRPTRRLDPTSACGGLGSPKVTCHEAKARCGCGEKAWPPLAEA